MHELVQSPLDYTPAGAGAAAGPALASVMEPVRDPRMNPVMDPVMFPVEEPFSATAALEMSGPIRDEIAKLVQKLFLAAQGPRRVVFTSTEAKAGTSWMCARVADTLAAQGRGSVCVVDCNLRTPGLHEQFGIENQRGLSDALMGGGSVREYTQRWSRNLWVLSAGGALESAASLLGSDRMRTRLAELKTMFEYTLVDAAPLNVCNDAIILGGQSEGVVLTLKANASRREAARKALHDMQSANVRVLGAVLNQRTFPIPEALYKRL